MRTENKQRTNVRAEPMGDEDLFIATLHREMQLLNAALAFGFIVTPEELFSQTPLPVGHQSSH